MQGANTVICDMCYVIKKKMDSCFRGNDIWGNGNDPSEIRFHGAGGKGWRVEGYFLILNFFVTNSLTFLAIPKHSFASSIFGI